MASLRRAASGCLREAGIRNPEREAAWLCEHVLHTDAAGLLRARDERVASRQARRVLHVAARRAAGEPLQYVIGDADFCGLRLAVGPGVLIPRPETEGLVAAALAALRSWGKPTTGLASEPAVCRVCDLCTGSGAIALAIAAAAGVRVEVTGTDISQAALRYARRNRRRLGLTQVRFREGDLFAGTGQRPRWHVVTANPPYIAPRRWARLPAGVRNYEPREALWAADNGLAVFRRLAKEARARLLPGGWLFCELDSRQCRTAVQFLAHAGYAEVSTHRDLFGRWRYVHARIPCPLPRR